MVGIKRPYHMLVADDDPGFRETLRMLLEPFFQLIEAASGEEAVDIAGCESIDIALLDMNMPVFTGLETTRAIKSQHEAAPCILITGEASEELCRDADEADVFSVLAKPVSKQDLFVTVSTALEDAYHDFEVAHLLLEDRQSGVL